jgi:hypothetical protein
MAKKDLYFSSDSGISSFNDIQRDPEYYKLNKNKEIFIINIKPEDYLTMCSEGFSFSGFDKDSFVPETDKTERAIKLFEEAKKGGKKIDLPYIVEEYTDHWSEGVLSYEFKQEGRHRALEAIRLGLKTIPITYIRNTDSSSRIGMDKYIPNPKQNSIKDKQLIEWTTSANKLIKDITNNLIPFKISYKRYKDSSNLAAFKTTSVTEDYEPEMFLNFYLDKKVKEAGRTNNLEYIAIDSILHEYGHMLFELFEDSSAMDKIKDFYNEKFITLDNMKREWIAYVNEEEYMHGYDEEIDNEDGYSEYWEYFIEEQFAEGFSKYIRIKSNDNFYFDNVRSIPDMKIVKEEKDFFDLILKTYNQDIIECIEEVNYNLDLEVIDNTNINQKQTIIKQP